MDKDAIQLLFAVAIMAFTVILIAVANDFSLLQMALFTLSGYALFAVVIVAGVYWAKLKARYRPETK